MLRNWVAKIALAAGLSMTALVPAGAAGFHGGFGGGFHGGFAGGFHGPVGGGFHGAVGGFHPGFAGVHPGFVHPGFVNPGFANRGFVNPGVHPFIANRAFAFGGRARFFRFHHRFFPFGAGVLAAPFAYDYAYDYPYAYDEDYGSCYLARRWVWNGYRHVHRLVRVCDYG